MTAGSLVLARFLWPGFRRILLRLGRWVARELVCEGSRALAAILRSGVRRLQAKRKALSKKKHLRRSWLGGRIRRWRSAARWFEGRRVELKKRIVDWLDKRIDDAIPEQSPLENYRAWSRARAA